MFGEFDLLFLLLAFCGGIFGAAIGALPSFVLCGFAALIGGGVSIATNGAVLSVDGLITWGPFVGPQTAFAGGTAAAAFAKKIGKLENGRDIITPLLGIDSPLTLVVGGVFGVIGALITWFLTMIPSFSGGALAEGVTVAPVNAIALAIIICMIITRVVFGQSGLLGDVPVGKNRWVSDDRGSWVPWQSNPIQIFLVSFSVALPTAWLTQVLPVSGLFIFAFGCLVFIYLQFGAKIPIFHHIALAAILGTTTTGSIEWGLAMGVASGFLAEVFAVLFVYHGDTHIDPPTFALAAMGTIQPFLIWTGFMPVNSTEVNQVNAYILLSALLLFIPFFFLIRKNRGEEQLSNRVINQTTT